VSDEKKLKVMREVQKNIRKNAPEKKIYILPHKAKDYQEKKFLLEEMTKSKKLQENLGLLEKIIKINPKPEDKAEDKPEEKAIIV